MVALAGLLGGIDPLALIGSFLVAIGCAFVGCSLALTLSVYGRKTHEVLIMTYLISSSGSWRRSCDDRAHGCWWAGRLPGRLRTIPWKTLYAGSGDESLLPGLCRPTSSPGKVGMEDLPGIPGGPAWLSRPALMGLATARIRGVALSQAGRPAARAGWRLPSSLGLVPAATPTGPSLDGNPVAWREWHRTRPSTMMRVAWGIYAALGLLWVCAGEPVRRAVPRGDEEIALMNVFQVDGRACCC